MQAVSRTEQQGEAIPPRSCKPALLMAPPLPGFTKAPGLFALAITAMKSPSSLRFSAHFRDPPTPAVSFFFFLLISVSSWITGDSVGELERKRETASLCHCLVNVLVI